MRVDGQNFQATVAGRFPEVDPATRTQTVVLRLEKPAAERLVQGQVVRLRLRDSVATDGFWLPSTALTKGSRGLWTALVAEEVGSDGASARGLFRVARRDLEVLHTASDRVLVRTNCARATASCRVISSGTHRIVPGQAVHVNN